MSYRVLSIMAVLDRRWATRRLRSLQSWVSMWTMNEMYAGAGSQGAEDAWYQTQLDLELLRLEGESYCGGTADTWKFCDQILRPLVYEFAEVAGMPSQILDTYKRHPDGLLISA